MIDEFYQAALSALEHHLDEAGVPYTVDDGEILFGSHRLGLAIAFDHFVPQGEHTLAPLDIQLHLDGDNGDRFRVGALGVGADRSSAMHDAVNEWHLLAAAPVLAALGAGVQNRREPAPQNFNGWQCFAGRVCIRGSVPPDLRAGGAFYRSLVDRLRQFVAGWPAPREAALRSIFVMATCGGGSSDIQAAADGLVDAKLVELVSGLPWPDRGDTYLYKQLFVLRHDGAE